MHDFPSNLHAEIIAAAHTCYPQEMCGLVVDNQHFLRAANLAENPKIDFILDPQTWAVAEAMGEITCLAHSHTNGNQEFSAADVRACKKEGVPFYLYTLPIGTELYFDPNVTAPYLEREWHYGWQDCYSLFKDWYQQELGIELEDFDRGEVYDWLEPTWNKFMENIPRQGFVRLAEPVPQQRGDLILMQYEAPNPNHIGVYVEPDRNLMLHHCLGRLSEFSQWGGFWKKITVSVWRHQNLC